jgi:hypothetical protein
MRLEDLCSCAIGLFPASVEVFYLFACYVCWWYCKLNFRGKELLLFEDCVNGLVVILFICLVCYRLLSSEILLVEKRA